ncbi:MAG: DUF998 domain-containing protein [Bauldia sp.]|nr:DUF998 domain-containing protein [Bauldia sp.]
MSIAQHAADASQARAAGSYEAPLAGLLLFIAAAQFMLVMMLAGSIAPGYSQSQGAISDLGAIGETSRLFNTSLLAVGLLTAAAGALLYRHHRRVWLLGLFLLAAAGAFGAGLVPLDRNADIHGLSALVAFVAFSLIPAACVVLLNGWARPLSILATAASVAYVVIMIIGDGGNPGVFGAIGHGGAERMIVYPVMLWLMAFGGYLMAGGGPRQTIAGR